MTKPTMPTMIQVGPHKYDVTDAWKDLLKENKVLGMDPGEGEGISNHKTGKIIINPRQHFTQRQDTLLHEVLHCVWRNNDWDTKIPKDDPEEYVVKRMTATLLDTLQRNPQLIEYLLYGEGKDADVPTEFITKPSYRVSARASSNQQHSDSSSDPVCVLRATTKSK